MPDRWRERVTLWVGIFSILGTLATGLLWASGKVGIVVAGPPERIDSLVQTAHALSTIDSVRHATMDSVNATQDRRITALETLASQQMALSCVNTKPRDLVLVRIPCGQYVGRWRAPGATP